jgi:hypothetical protein
MATYESDRKMGCLAEKKFKKIMKKKFKIDLEETDRYCFYDFISHEKNVIIELKKRKINKDMYPTTIIGYDKIAKFMRLNKKNNNKYKFLLVFYFTDGIYYFVHDNNYNYQIKSYKRKPIPGANDKEKEHVFIPIKHLKPLKNIKNEFECNKKLLVRYNL